MKLNQLTVAVAALMFFGCGTSTKQEAKNSIIIEGNVKFPDNKYNMQIVKREGFNKVILDSCKVNEDGTYRFELEVENPGTYSLECQGWQSVNFWAEDEDLKIDFRGQDTARIKIKNPPYVLIQGGEKNDLMNLANWNNYRNYQMMIGLSQGVYRIEKLESKDKQEVSMGFYDLLGTDHRARTTYLVEQYGDVSSVLALLPSIRDEKLIASTLAKLDAKYPNYKPVADYKAKVAEAKALRERLAIGKIAPKFSFPTEDGKKNYGPQDFKGKILVLDFWASWCGPCRAEIPHLKELYAKYGKENVEFLSVSIDKKDADWKKALADEKMTWPQVQAPGAGKDIMKEYQFSGIPYIVVLNKDGEIVGKNLRGESLTKKLEELVAGKGEKKKSVAMPAMGMSM